MRRIEAVLVVPRLVRAQEREEAKMGKNVHVVKHENGWAAKKEGGQRASVVTETQQGAIEVGRKLAKHEGSELVVHGRDGKIREKDSHGHDPSPSRG